MEALKKQIATSPTLITFTTIANHLATAVADLPDNVSKRRNINGVSTTDGSKAIYRADGSINTGHIDGWFDLSESNRQIVTNGRSRLTTGGLGNRGG